MSSGIELVSRFRYRSHQRTAGSPSTLARLPPPCLAPLQLRLPQATAAQTLHTAIGSWSPRRFRTMAQAPEKKAEKSYLSTAVDSINPWAAGRTTDSGQPKRPTTPTPSSTPVPPSSGRPRDHSTNPLYGISWQSYPEDCPPLRVLWFHAVDVGATNLRGCLPCPSQHQITNGYFRLGSKAEAERCTIQHQQNCRQGQRQAPAATQKVYCVPSLRFACY